LWHLPAVQRCPLLRRLVGVKRKCCERHQFDAPDPSATSARNFCCDAAVAFGITLRMMPFRSAAEIESGFGTVERDRIDGLVVLPDTSTTRYSDLIVALAARHRLPAMYPYRDFVNSGGLLCYGVDRADLYRRAASYVDHLARREAIGPSSAGADQIRTLDQSQDREDAWPYRAADTARPRRRGDRVGPDFCCVADEVIE
jgi:hypothetical protein